MIVEWFVDFVFGLVGVLFDLLPAADALPFGDIGPVFAVVGGLNDALPMTEALAAVALLLSVNLGLLLFGIIRQVWRFVPIVGGG